MVGCQGIKVIDGSETGVEYVTGYMTCLAELFKKSHLTRLDSNSDHHVSSDYLIGCIVDQQTATISYTVNKEHISNCDIKVCMVHTRVLQYDYDIYYSRSVTLLSSIRR